MTTAITSPITIRPAPPTTCALASTCAAPAWIAEPMPNRSEDPVAPTVGEAELLADASERYCLYLPLVKVAHGVQLRPWSLILKAAFAAQLRSKAQESETSGCQ